MSDNLVFGQGTYHRTDMLPDSGEEANSLWARYAMENAEWVYAHRLTMLDSRQEDAALTWIFEGGEQGNYSRVVRVDDMGTFHIAGSIVADSANAGTWVFKVNTSVILGTIHVTQNQGSRFELTYGAGTRFGAHWATFEITDEANDEGTLNDYGLWGQP